MIEIDPKKKEKENYSSYYSNLQDIHGFQAVNGRTRPGTNTKIVNTNQNDKFLRNQLIQNDLFFFSFIHIYLELPIQLFYSDCGGLQLRNHLLNQPITFF